MCKNMSEYDLSHFLISCGIEVTRRKKTDFAMLSV